MQAKSKIYILLAAALILIAAGWLSTSFPRRRESSSPTPHSNEKPTSLRATEGSVAIPSSTTHLIEPVANFKQRVTKKPFGIYVTPQHSPVSPERFAGYHTGADAEYGDVTADVPVRAITDGRVLSARWVTGYGGAVAIQHVINNQNVIAIYGHLRPSSLPQAGQEAKAGQQIGLLGTAFSNETDGERRHLHFAIFKGTTIDWRGYVSSKPELSKWLNPLAMF